LHGFVFTLQICVFPHQHSQLLSFYSQEAIQAESMVTLLMLVLPVCLSFLVH